MRPLREFAEKHPSKRLAVEQFIKYIRRKEVDWLNPKDVVDSFGVSRVDILGNDRVCINMAGNDIRIILKVRYGYGMCFVRWIGLHKDYDKLENIDTI